MDNPELQNAAQTDAERVLADNKAVIDAIEDDEEKAAAYISAHMAWAIGLVCFLVGFVVGHLRL